MENVLIAIGFIVVLSIVFVLGSVWNSQTDRPEGCSQLHATCHSCTDTSCTQVKG